MSGTCIFCDARQDSNEHVFPRWLRDLFPEDTVGPALAQFIEGEPGDEPYNTIETGAIATIEAGIVCHECNTSWMSNMESQTRPLIEPQALGQRATLDMAEEVQLAAWAVKTCMTCEMTLRRRENLFSPADRQVVRIQRRPPASVIVQAAAYTGTNGPLEYVKLAAAMWRNGAYVGDLTLHTLKIGCLILRVAAFPSGDNVAMKKIAVPRDMQIPLFPPVRSCEWPPAIVLNDASLRLFRLPPGAAGPPPQPPPG